jgi:hypothetical protein
MCSARTERKYSNWNCLYFKRRALLFGSKYFLMVWGKLGSWKSALWDCSIFFHGTAALSGPGLLIIQAACSHSVRHTTLGRTSVGEWSAQCRDFYLTTHSTHKRQTSMPLGGFEPTIPANERSLDSHLRPCCHRDWPKTVLWKKASWTAGDMMYY